VVDFSSSCATAPSDGGIVVSDSFGTTFVVAIGVVVVVVVTADSRMPTGSSLTLGPTAALVAAPVAAPVAASVAVAAVSWTGTWSDSKFSTGTGTGAEETETDVVAVSVAVVSSEHVALIDGGASSLPVPTIAPLLFWLVFSRHLSLITWLLGATATLASSGNDGGGTAGHDAVEESCTTKSFPVASCSLTVVAVASAFQECMVVVVVSVIDGDVDSGESECVQARREKKREHHKQENKERVSEGVKRKRILK
jgi:hypothetical protein